MSASPNRLGTLKTVRRKLVGAFIGTQIREKPYGIGSQFKFHIYLTWGTL
jgi:hypothetical protein